MRLKLGLPPCCLQVQGEVEAKVAATFYEVSGATFDRSVPAASRNSNGPLLPPTDNPALNPVGQRRRQRLGGMNFCAAVQMTCLKRVLLTINGEPNNDRAPAPSSPFG
jgi:hypothetical protein